MPDGTIQGSHIDVIVAYKPFRHRCKPRTEQESPMWYGNTKNLLESIVRGLKTEPPSQRTRQAASLFCLVRLCAGIDAVISRRPHLPDRRTAVLCCRRSDQLKIIRRPKWKVRSEVQHEYVS